MQTTIIRRGALPVAIAALMALLFAFAAPASASPIDKGDEPGEGDYGVKDVRLHFAIHLAQEAVKQSDFDIAKYNFRDGCYDDGTDDKDTKDDTVIFPDLFQDATVAKGKLQAIDLDGDKDITADPEDEILLKHLCWLQERNVIAGFTNGNFGPGEDIDRDQAASFVARGFASIEDGVKDPVKYFNDEKLPEASAFYSDVSDNNTHSEAIAFLSDPDGGKAFIVQGYSDGTFRPDNRLLKGQTHLIVKRWAESFSS